MVGKRGCAHVLPGAFPDDTNVGGFSGLCKQGRKPEWVGKARAAKGNVGISGIKVEIAVSVRNRHVSSQIVRLCAFQAVENATGSSQWHR